MPDPGAPISAKFDPSLVEAGNHQRNPPAGPPATGESAQIASSLRHSWLPLTWEAGFGPGTTSVRAQSLRVWPPNSDFLTPRSMCRLALVFLSAVARLRRCLDSLLPGPRVKPTTHKHALSGETALSATPFGRALFWAARETLHIADHENMLRRTIHALT